VALGAMKQSFPNEGDLPSTGQMIGMGLVFLKWIPVCGDTYRVVNIRNY
jgi:hypothetical protein